jgi:hypothetical protein
MDAQRTAIDAIVALTDCDREMVAAFIRRFYLAGVKDPKRLKWHAVITCDKRGSVCARKRQLPSNPGFHLSCWIASLRSQG